MKTKQYTNMSKFDEGRNQKINFKFLELNENENIDMKKE